MFSLDKITLEKLAQWKIEHDKICCLSQTTTAIGGKLTYSFTPTSLFTKFEVECACGEKIDLTDYQEW